MLWLDVGCGSQGDSITQADHSCSKYVHAFFLGRGFGFLFNTKQKKEAMTWHTEVAHTSGLHGRVIIYMIAETRHPQLTQVREAPQSLLMEQPGEMRHL